MLRKSLVFALASATVCLASAAHAQTPAPSGLGSSGQLILGAERIFGFSASSFKTEETTAGTTVTNTTSHTQFGLLIQTPNNPYLIPRIGIDYTVIDNLTLGGSIGFLTDSSKRKSEAGSTSTERDGPTSKGFLFAPRVGYVLGLSDVMYVWLRGGVTYFNISSESESTAGTTTSTNKSTISGLALSFDPAFVVTPVEHFGFFASAAIDVGLSGKDKDERTSGGVTTSAEIDAKYSSFGLQFGVLGYF